MRQQITVPSGANLHYWWYLVTQKTGTRASDFLKVQVLNTSGVLLATLRSWNNTSTPRNTYSQDTVSLAAYSGQTVILRFLSTTNGSLSTSEFFVDDVVSP